MKDFSDAVSKSRKVPSNIEHAFEGYNALTDKRLESFVGSWDEMVLLRAYLVLRKMGYPTGGHEAVAVFLGLVKVFEICKEIEDEDLSVKERSPSK